MVGIVELAVAFYFADDMIMEGKGEERAWLIDFRSIFFTKYLHFNINSQTCKKKASYVVIARKRKVLL